MISQIICDIPLVQSIQPRSDTSCEWHTDIFWRGTISSSVGQTWRTVEI